MKIEGLTSPGACSKLAKYEAITVEVLEPFMHGICQNLKGWTVEVLDTDGRNWWTDEWGRDVSGLTYCDYFSIEVGTEDWAESAYSHEITHAWFCPDGNPEHLYWDEMGYYRAFEEINKRYRAR